ncbi:hypothetical protein [Cellulosimicrobium sp. CUA-896]|uniref:hypothetical protein n=1 Tax=Cellulosimicrobium sp. CUA-896 TaxID=1517881 RepID=UPI000963070E|nr:hypothetical protein [Cellulosimicrobium sp. CUA-896]OLT53985.1 hypothetical protein BJF88_00345 [Cellulosimicrobium sp. CUA-896]
MTTPRHAPLDTGSPARPGHAPRRSDAVVRQRLRAVAGGQRRLAPPSETPAVTAGGRPVLAWQPVSGAPVPARSEPVRAVEHEPVRDAELEPVPVAEPGAGAGADPGAQPGAPGDGWLPERPGAVRASSPRGGARTGEVPGATADELALRARRRAATTVAQAYAAAHGHPTAHSGFAGLDEPDEEAGGSRPRVAVPPRVAVAAAVVLLAVAAVAGFVTLRPEPVAAFGVVGAAAAGEEATRRRARRATRRPARTPTAAARRARPAPGPVTPAGRAGRRAAATTLPRRVRPGARGRSSCTSWDGSRRPGS